MPLYQYKCDQCGAYAEKVNRIDDHLDGPECHGQMRQVVEACNVQALILGGSDHPGYVCPVTDKYVTSRRERRNIMAEHDLIPLGNEGRIKPTEH